MHLFKLDSFIYKIYKNKWKLEEDELLIPSFSPPKTWNLKFIKKLNDTSEITSTPSEELILYQYPTHYKHMNVSQYDYGFFIYFSIVGSFLLLKGLSDLRKKSYKSFGLFSFMSAFTFFEGYVISRRVKDVKSISLKNGESLCVKTFQDGELEYRMDMKDFRIVNKDIENLIILIDVNMAKNKNFQFFFIEPTPATVYNPELFSTVLVDKRYLTYKNHQKKEKANKLI